MNHVGNKMEFNIKVSQLEATCNVNCDNIYDTKPSTQQMTE